MLKIFFLTYFSLCIIYIWIYSIDSRIVYPYKPFKLKKQKGIFSKYLIVCKDRKRGMVNFTFYMQMLAHIYLIISTVFLTLIYYNKWYQNEEFFSIYKNILVTITFLLFSLPLTIAGAIHDLRCGKKKKT